MADNQEKLKRKEREIPVFTVLKNNCILKNIFLLDNPPSISPPSSSAAENFDQESEIEEILVVGRHPDCSIKLEHPSISRFHLRIHSKPSSRSLFVTDLSSAHGTWISGKRIDPGVRMKLNEGDTLRLGASSRLYSLNWVPLSCAYDIDNPFVPELDCGDTVDEETNGAIDQDGNGLSYKYDQVQPLSDDIEGLELLFSEEDIGSCVQKISPTAPPMPEDLYHSLSSKEEVENSSSFNQENEHSSNQLCQFEKENKTPRAHFLSAVSQTVSQLQTTEISGMNSEKRSVSIWSRRGKPESVQVETSRSRGGNSARSNMNLHVKSLVHENYKCESILNDHYTSLDNDEETFTQDKENTSPSSLPVRSKKSKSISKTYISRVDQGDEEIFTPDKENMTPKSHLLRSTKGGKLEEVKHPKLYSPDNKEGIFTPDKENTPSSLPVRYLKSISEETLRSKSISKTYISCVDQGDEELFTPDKENMTPKSHLLRSTKGGKLEEVTHLKLCSPDIEEETFTPDKDNISPSLLLVKSLKSKGEKTLKSKSVSNTPISGVDQDDEEIFTPDKENMTPKSHLLRSMNIGKLEVKHPKLYRSSPLKTDDQSQIYPEEAMRPTSDKASQHRKVLQERDSTSSASKSRGNLMKQPILLKSRADRDPFHPLPTNSTSNCKANPKPSVHDDTMRGSRSINYHESEEHKTALEKRSWTIIVDTGCLLNKNSRRELQLLQGLRGTTLVIPRIVIRELDCLLRRGSFFTRKTEVSAALQWIEDCMAVAKWWVHVQSSAEEGRLIPPTPPASPHWFSESKGAFSVGSIPFSPHSLQEIVTPTTADHILECALYFKRTRSDGQLVLLSDDVTLKIKAMAEGVVCETAEEFRGSLVNPFSSRFLYSDSSPIGPTWSCVDDDVLKERYYPSPSKRLSKPGEVAKGLKLILLHNSNFRQTPAS